MDIINKFSEQEIPEIAVQIFKLIHDEPSLTKRSGSYIINLLTRECFYVMVDPEKHVIGFIAKEHLTDNYYELKSWYIVPSKRSQGLSDKIFLEAIKNKRNKYLGVTFQKEIVKRLQSYGFKQVSLTGLPPKVLLKYLITRQWKSIVKHLFVRKSYIVVKT